MKGGKGKSCVSKKKRIYMSSLSFWIVWVVGLRCNRYLGFRGRTWTSLYTQNKTVLDFRVAGIHHRCTEYRIHVSGLRKERKGITASPRDRCSRFPDPTVKAKPSHVRCRQAKVPLTKRVLVLHVEIQPPSQVPSRPTKHERCRQATITVLRAGQRKMPNKGR